MKYSPKLKKAMAEIKLILEKHDIAGFVVLHDPPSYSEYLNHITPSYSCATFDESAGALRLKTNSKVDGKEKTHRKVANTYNMIHHMAVVIGKFAVTYIDIEEFLKKELGGTSIGDDDHSTEQQQNN